MKYANLHLHSTFSDGIFTPEELCRKARDMGYRALSVTDHQCAAGGPALKEAAERYGMGYLPGMELYGKTENGTVVHLTAYDFDTREQGMAAFLREEAGIAADKTERQLKACQAAGYFPEITWKNVLEVSQPGAWLCNEQIFLALQRQVGCTQKDYWTFNRQFKSAAGSIPSKKPIPTTKEMITLVRNAGGMILLAHPHGITQLLPSLCREGLMGVEYDHPDIDEADAYLAREYALAHRLYLSGGTDHTGILGDNMERGDIPGRKEGRGDASLVPYDTDVRCGCTEEEFDAMKHRIYG